MGKGADAAGKATNQEARRDIVSAVFVAAVAGSAVVCVWVVFFLKLRDVATALTAAVVSALPIILAWLTYRIITLKNAGKSIEIEVPAEPGPAERARALWNFERCHASRCTQSTSAYAILWGASTTLTIAGVLTFHCMDGGPQNQPSEICAKLTGMVIASMGGAFLLSLAQVLVRIAGDDASRRMFAVGFRTSVSALVTTVLLFFAIKPLNLPFLAEASTPGPFIAAGLMIAVLGPDLLSDLPRRIAPLLGLKLRTEEQGTPLTAIDGLTSDEIERLDEEGIASVEAIAHNPLPRMYFNTGFSLERICEWHDQALLVSHLGADAGKRLRAQFGIRGACELRRQLMESGDSVAPLLGQVLDGATPEKLKAVCESLEHDEAVALVDVFRRSNLHSERRGPVEPESAPEEERDERPRLVK